MSYYGKTPAQIVVAGRTLVTDDGDARWSIQEIDGWYNGPGIEVTQEQRDVHHGQFAQAGRRTGRTVTISGVVDTDTRATAAAAVSTINSLLADGSFDQIEVADDDEGTLWATVQLLDRPQIDWSDGTKVRYQLQVLAPDAYRYGDVAADTTGFAMDPEGAGLVFPLFPDGVLDFGPLGEPGIATVSNPGTATAPVIFTVTGPAPAAGFVITDTETGKKITYLGDLPDGSVLVLDGSDGSVVIDDVADRSGDTIVEAWPQIPAGQTRDFLFEPLSGTSAAELTVSCTATYW